MESVLTWLAPFADSEDLINDPHKHRDLRCEMQPEYKTTAAGAIVKIENRRTAVLCSAVAISPRRIATAAHCLWQPTSRASYYFTLEDDAFIPQRGYPLGQPRRHDRLDVGTADLLHTAFGRQIELPGFAQLGTKLAVGQRVLKVGYGVWSHPARPGSITSTIGDRTCAVMAVSEIRGAEYKYIPYDPPAGQICSGDSGGPALVLDDKDRTVLIGITARSPEETAFCGTGGTDVWISAEVALWLRS